MINMEAKLTRGETEINHIEYSMVIIKYIIICRPPLPKQVPQEPLIT